MSSDGTSDTSHWIKFFVEAGIPPSDAAHYAVMFADNRINDTMLLDLNKDYLNDMGISRLGDVIAILKKAKDVHKKLLEERVLRSGLKLTTGISGISRSLPNVPLTVTTQSTGIQTKRDTLMTRIVGHCLASRRSESPVTIQPSGIGSRLGPERATVPAGKTTKPRRNIYMPDEKMPPTYGPELPTTLAASVSNKKSVFDRLGENGNKPMDTTPAPESLSHAKASPDSVFKRLGGKRSTPSDTPPASNEPQGSPLPYAGVLRSPIKRLKPTPPSVKVRISNKVNTAPPCPSSDSSSEGILRDGNSIPKRLKDRLGKVVSPADTTDTSGSTSLDKPMKMNLKITTKNSLVAAGNSPSEVSSSSDHSTSSTKPSILSRLGRQL